MRKLYFPVSSCLVLWTYLLRNGMPQGAVFSMVWRKIWPVISFTAELFRTRALLRGSLKIEIWVEPSMPSRTWSNFQLIADYWDAVLAILYMFAIYEKFVIQRDPKDHILLQVLCLLGSIVCSNSRTGVAETASAHHRRFMYTFIPPKTILEIYSCPWLW